MRKIIFQLSIRHFKKLTAKDSLSIFLLSFYSFVFFIIMLLSSCRKNDFKVISISSLNSSQAASGKPNIIVILGDDIGYDAISSQGNSTFQTPNIDAMANAGMRFTQCHSSPLCSPSRVTIVSGQYNFRNYTVWGYLDPNQKTFATLLRDAGYATYVAGKWQFDGGDFSIHSLGFNSYCVWNPIQDDPAGSRYKDPKIYQQGAYVSSSKTQGQYGDDIFTDSVLLFIQKNKNKNFFVYYPITLCHYPYCPTPDDPEFKNWNSKTDKSDTAFFPSMINYMDKKVGQIIDSLKKWNLYHNTILMFIGDNGTPHHIFYYYNGTLTEGGKSNTTEAGTHVPLIVTWPAKITPVQTNRNLVDFTDFLPTFADAAGVGITSDYGIIDGHSFFNQLTGASYVPRDWIFDHYQPNTNSGNDKLRRWVQDTTYKLYDSTEKFYNILLDPLEKNPIRKKDMTHQEKLISNKFQSIMDTLK